MFGQSLITIKKCMDFLSCLSPSGMIKYISPGKAIIWMLSSIKKDSLIRLLKAIKKQLALWKIHSELPPKKPSKKGQPNSKNFEPTSSGINPRLQSGTFTEEGG